MNSNSKVVTDFYAAYEQHEGKQIQDDCMFAVEFRNPENGAKIRSVLQGKQTLEKCLDMAYSTRQFLADKAAIDIDVFFAGGTEFVTSKLANMFESGIKIVNDPKTFGTRETLNAFEDLYQTNLDAIAG